MQLFHQQGKNPTGVTKSNTFFRSLIERFSFFRKLPLVAEGFIDMTGIQLLGSRYLSIELPYWNHSSEYSEKWKNLVQVIALFTEPNLTGSGKEVEEQFIKGVIQAMKHYRIRPGDVEPNFLHSAIDRRRFNCLYSTLLVYDVAQVLQIPVQMIEAPGHLLLTTENFYFETRKRRYGPISDLLTSYQTIHSVTAEQIRSAAHNALGNDYFHQGYYYRATAEYEKALELNPNDSCAGENLEKAQRNIREIEERVEIYM